MASRTTRRLAAIDVHAVAASAARWPEAGRKGKDDDGPWPQHARFDAIYRLGTALPLVVEADSSARLYGQAVAGRRASTSHGLRRTNAPV